MGKTVKRTIVFMMVVLLGSVPSSKSIQITSRAKKIIGKAGKNTRLFASSRQVARK